MRDLTYKLQNGYIDPDHFDDNCNSEQCLLEAIVTDIKSHEFKKNEFNDLFIYVKAYIDDLMDRFDYSFAVSLVKQKSFGQIWCSIYDKTFTIGVHGCDISFGDPAVVCKQLFKLIMDTYINDIKKTAEKNARKRFTMFTLSINSNVIFTSDYYEESEYPYGVLGYDEFLKFDLENLAEPNINSEIVITYSTISIYGDKCYHFPSTYLTKTMPLAEFIEFYKSILNK